MLSSNMKFIILCLFSLFLIKNSATAQDTLSLLDQNYLKRLNNELILSSDQNLKIENIFLNHHFKISTLNHTIDSLEKSEINEEILNTRISVLNKEKSDLIKYREDLIKLELSESQRLIYNEKMNIQKPKVLHFGIHNRADCEVCKTQ